MLQYFGYSGYFNFWNSIYSIGPEIIEHDNVTWHYYKNKKSFSEGTEINGTIEEIFKFVEESDNSFRILSYIVMKNGKYDNMNGTQNDGLYIKYKK